MKYGERVPANCDFADDNALILTFTFELEAALKTVSEEALKVGQHITWQKTKVMIIDPVDKSARPPAFNALVVHCWNC